jgi:putative endonuclease
MKNKKDLPANGNILKGRGGENIACAYLKSKGYRVLSRNFTTEAGEIDVIFTDENTLIFGEVKTRFSDGYGFPAEAVTYRKRAAINRVASQYIKKFMLFGADVRFDIIEVYASENRVNHIENAFDSYLRY